MAPAPSGGAGGRLPLLLAVVVGAVVAVAAGLWLLRDDGSGHPSAWDERVVDLVEFVEDERGHDFAHPVHVDFLTPEEYADRTRGDAGELTEEDEAEIERAEAILRALGLVQGDVDLFESTNDIVDSGTLAFYDLDEERIVVRGTEVTPRLAATLVHELTHALQHQTFPRTELLVDPGDAADGAVLAMRGLVEGDADRIERAYVEGLSADERAEIEQADEDNLEEVEGEEIPEALLASFGLPYALGGGFVDALAAEGRTAIDRAFNDPPTTEEHLLVPRTYLEGDQPHVVSVSTPDDVEVIDDGDFGAANLMLVLGSRLPAHDALVAAMGWGGDDYAVYELDGRTCVDLVVSTDTDLDAIEPGAALTAWVEAGPEGAAEVRVDDRGDVALHACDPGTEEVELPEHVSPMSALTLAAVRTVFLAQATEGGFPPDAADCFADEVIASFTVEEITAEEAPPDTQARIAAAAQRCGG